MASNKNLMSQKLKEEIAKELGVYDKVKEEFNEMITDDAINEIYDFFKVKNPYLEGKK